MTKLVNMDFEVLGRHFGKASGWDMVDDFEVQLYDFIPGPGIDLPKGDVSVNFVTGRVAKFNDDGVRVFERDVVGLLKNVPWIPKG